MCGNICNSEIRHGLKFIIFEMQTIRQVSRWLNNITLVFNKIKVRKKTNVQNWNLFDLFLVYLINHYMYWVSIVCSPESTTGIFLYSVVQWKVYFAWCQYDFAKSGWTHLVMSTIWQKSFEYASIGWNNFRCSFSHISHTTLIFRYDGIFQAT